MVVGFGVFVVCLFVCLCVSPSKWKITFSFQKGGESKTCSPLSKQLVWQSYSAKHMFGLPSVFLSARPLCFNSLHFFGVMLFYMVGCFFPQIVQKEQCITLKRLLCLCLCETAYT